VRARIVLAAAAELTNKQIAAKLTVCAHIAGLWRRRFAADRMDGLYNEPRPGNTRRSGNIPARSLHVATSLSACDGPIRPVAGAEVLQHLCAASDRRRGDRRDDPQNAGDASQRCEPLESECGRSFTHGLPPRGDVIPPPLGAW
jgi:hypothetical protein